MNKKGFSPTIPQMVKGFLGMFFIALGLVIFWPLISQILNLTWNDTQTFLLLKVSIWLIIAFLVYIIGYGAIMGRPAPITRFVTGNNAMEGQQQ